MTHAMAARTGQALAHARHQVAEHASDMEMWLTTHDRDQVVIANALQLTEDYASDPLQLAYIAAEAIAQTVPPVRIVVDIPAPCEWISSNDRGKHWGRKADLTAQWRAAAGWRARQAKVSAMQRADIEVRVVFPNARRRDPHNLTPTIKACIDGLVDVGMLPDDDAKHLTITRIDRTIDPSVSDRGILRLLITEVTP